MSQPGLDHELAKIARRVHSDFGPKSLPLGGKVGMGSRVQEPYLLGEPESVEGRGHQILGRCGIAKWPAGGPSRRIGDVLCLQEDAGRMSLWPPSYGIRLVAGP